MEHEVLAAGICGFQRDRSECFCHRPGNRFRVTLRLELRPDQADHRITVYERAGTSNLVRPPVVEGLSNVCGATCLGASKLLKAFKSVPLRTLETSTWPGIMSCQLISTTCGFERSRFRTKIASFPSPGSMVPATSRYGT